MRRGKYAANEATLRMKMDMLSPNPNMWDQVAYRIKYVAHPHAGDAWCIYPTYDFTHCIIDSLEHVDYSICTLEFETRRESYYWVLQALDLYRPKVRSSSPSPLISLSVSLCPSVLLRLHPPPPPLFPCSLASFPCQSPCGAANLFTFLAIHRDDLIYCDCSRGLTTLCTPHII